MSESSIEPQPTGGVGASQQRPRVKYQVFVSSTYVDLHKERERVVWAVLEARQIPVGMENFTAADERGWKTITRVINDTDYYVLILAGLYGSMDPATGISWTQREYEYATSQGIPVLAFIREQSSIPGDKVETDPDKRKKLQDFIRKVKESHLCKTWKNADELSAAVASALRNSIQDDADDGKSRPGWIRGDSLPSMESFEELARLSAENARLRAALEAVQAANTQRSKLSLVRQTTNAPVESSTQLERSIIVPTDISHLHPDDPLRILNVQRNRTVWFKLAIGNSGAVAARNAVVDFEFPEALKIHLHLNRNSLDADKEENKELFMLATDPTKHCHVDKISKQAIRQRIKLVSPGVIEQLVRFGVELPVTPELNAEYEFSVHFSIVDEDGTSSSGQFSVAVKWNKIESRRNLLFRE
jgi:hypothetical protein